VSADITVAKPSGTNVTVKSYSLAVWVSADGTQEPLQATGGDLTSL
jgi:hypothetical protein